MSHGIPDGEYELKIGSSFGKSQSSQAEFNTLRFDFKPASFSSGNEAYIATSQQSEEVQVIVPGDNQKSTIFRGSRKPIKGEKECLLVFDHRTKELRLEKLSANINVKKTRDTEVDSHVKNEIDWRRKQKMPPEEAKVEKERTFSASSASLNGEDNDYGDMDIDEDATALEQMMAPKVAPTQEKSKSPPKQPSQSQQPNNKQPSPVKISSPKKAQKSLQKSILHEDLQLSESSDGESD